MKKILLILMTAYSFNLSAGQVHWITNTGSESNLNCTIQSHSHSDTVNLSEYWIDCGADDIPNVQNNITGKSIIYANGNTMICKMDSSTFGTGDNFLMLLDCRTKVFQNGFEKL